MNLKHRVRISVSGGNGTRKLVISGGQKSVRSKILDRLFGDAGSVLILRLGASVADVEVQEESEGGDAYAT